MKNLVENVIAQFNALCLDDKWFEAGELARSHKADFIKLLYGCSNRTLLFAYKNCHIFNMDITMCDNARNQIQPAL